MRVTDKDRLQALRRLAIKTGRYSGGKLPFRSEQLRYTSAFLNRFSKSLADGDQREDHSMLMVRSMVDEYLVEITAQIDWFERANGTSERRFVREFGLSLWDQNSPSINSTIKVA
jgi:hypothetical protein